MLFLSVIISVKTNQRKILSLFFILLGMLPFIFSLTAILRKQQIRHEMKERMEKSLLHTIILDEDNVVWMKPGKEIFVDGKMFDIKKTEKLNGKIIFHGLYDEEETALKNNINNSMKRDRSSQQTLLTNLFSLILGVYLDPGDADIPVSDLSTEKKAAIIHYWSQPILTILSPPPQGNVIV